MYNKPYSGQMYHPPQRTLLTHSLLSTRESTTRGLSAPTLSRGSKCLRQRVQPSKVAHSRRYTSHGVSRCLLQQLQEKRWPLCWSANSISSCVSPLMKYEVCIIFICRNSVRCSPCTSRDGPVEERFAIWVQMFIFLVVGLSSFLSTFEYYMISISIHFGAPSFLCDSLSLGAGRGRCNSYLIDQMTRLCFVLSS